MRRSAAILAVLAAANFSAARAQQSATFLAMPSQPASCPVSLSVRQRSATEVIRTGDLPPVPADPTAQHLEIGFHPRPDVQTIDAIELRVRGVGSARQTLPLREGADGSRADDVQQIFHLRRTAGTPTLTRSDIRIPRMNAVRWVELVSVTYTDGTTWRPVASLPCRTEPNRLLLVAGAN